MSLRSLAYGICLLAAVLLGAGCRKSAAPDVSGDAIRFDVGLARLATSPETRAPAAEEAPTQENYLIHENSLVGVYGTWTSPERESTDVFSKIPLECKSDGNGGYVWEYSPRQYWRHGGTYDFRAVYPFDVDTQFGAGGRNMVVSYSMLSENYDLLVAGETRNLSATDDRSPVPFRFQHALSAVRVVFQKGSDDPNRHYYLHSFELQHLHAVGILVYSGGTVDVASWHPSEYRTETVYPWSVPENVRFDVPKTYDEFKTESALAKYNWEQWHFVIPQALKGADGFNSAIRYSLEVEQYEDNGVTLAYRSEAPVYTTLPLPLEYKDDENITREVIWEPGKVYTYYIQIQAGWAFITVKVEPWERYFVYVDDIVF